MFEWDERKAAANRRKHGVTFDEAATVFLDALARNRPDDEHSGDEPRSLLLGRSTRGRLLVVAYAERGERLRLVSARRATRFEREVYEAAEEFA